MERVRVNCDIFYGNSLVCLRKNHRKKHLFLKKRVINIGICLFSLKTILLKIERLNVRHRRNTQLHNTDYIVATVFDQLQSKTGAVLHRKIVNF